MIVIIIILIILYIMHYLYYIYNIDASIRTVSLYKTDIQYSYVHTAHPTRISSGPSAYGHGLRLRHGPHGPHAGCLSADGRSHQQLLQSLGLDGPVAAVPDAAATGRDKKKSRCHGCGWTIPMNVMVLLGKYGKIWEHMGTYGTMRCKWRFLVGNIIYRWWIFTCDLWLLDWRVFCWYKHNNKSTIRGLNPSHLWSYWEWCLYLGLPHCT